MIGAAVEDSRHIQRRGYLLEIVCEVIDMEIFDVWLGRGDH